VWKSGSWIYSIQLVFCVRGFLAKQEFSLVSHAYFSPSFAPDDILALLNWEVPKRIIFQEVPGNFQIDTRN
jgi:hypothetical protein